MNMIKKLTIANFKGMIFILLFCFGLGGVIFWKYAPATLRLLQGNIRPESLPESVSNYYGLSALSLIFILLGLFILIKQLVNPIKKKVNKYITEHPEVTLEMLDDDFAGASQFGDIWVGRKFTYVTDLPRVLLENDKIVWVYQDVEYSRKSTTYFACWCMADGKEYRVRIAERKLKQMREHYASFPHILTEDSADYKYMFKHNINELLDIKYNQNIQQ